MEDENKYVEDIGVGEKLAYGCGDLASNLVLVLTGTFITFFYTDALGLNVAIVGTLILISRIFDGITDVIMGYIMDKTKSKYGKARPWMLWLAIPFGISTILLFTVPNLGDTGKYIYIFITYNLNTTFIYTAINIPYGALNSLMTRDQDQRANINIYRMAMANIGGLAINAFTMPLINNVGGSTHQSSWIIVSCIYGAMASLLFLLCFFKTKERVDLVTPEDRKISFGKTLKILFKNKYWLIICGVWVVSVLGMSMAGTVGVYYAKYILHNENLAGYFYVVESGVAIVLMITVIMPLIKKFGKRNVAFVGSIITLIGQLLMLTNPASVKWLMGCCVIRGFGTATLSGTIFAMIADTIEYGEWKTGIRVEGMLYSATTFGAKVGGGVGMAVASGILGSAGYDGTLAVQNPATINAISNLYLKAPIIFLVLVPILYWFYRLDDKYPTIMKELGDREKKSKQNVNAAI